MNCALLDIGCHIQGAAWEWWAEVSWLNKLLIVGGLVLIIMAAARTLLWLLHKVGGWPAVVGAIAMILGLVLAILPRKPKGSEAHETIPDNHPDAARPFEFGKKKRKKPRPTVRLPKLWVGR
jgi:uncharacterized membrane protein